MLSIVVIGTEGVWLLAFMHTKCWGSSDSPTIVELAYVFGWAYCAGLTIQTLGGPQGQ
jgi:hypothetical protein